MVDFLKDLFSCFLLNRFVFKFELEGLIGVRIVWILDILFDVFFLFLDNIFYVCFINYIMIVNYVLMEFICGKWFVCFIKMFLIVIKMDFNCKILLKIYCKIVLKIR